MFFQQHLVGGLRPDPVVDTGEVHACVAVRAALGGRSTDAQVPVAKRGQGFPVSLVPGVKTLEHQVPRIADHLAQVKLPHVVEDSVRARGFKLPAVPGPVYSHHQPKTATPAGLDTGGGILNHHRVWRSDAKPSCGSQENIRGRLTLQPQPGRRRPVHDDGEEILDARCFQDQCRVPA